MLAGAMDNYTQVDNGYDVINPHLYCLRPSSP